MRNIKELDKLINYIQDLYKPLPSLPKGLINFIVAITPWVALITGVLGVLGALAALGITAFFSPLMVLGGGVGTAAGVSIVAILNLAIGVIILMATPSLFARKAMGWRFLFLSELLGLLSVIVVLSIAGIVWQLIWFYVLFQIRPNYKQ